MQGRGQGRGRGQCHPDAGEGLIVGVESCCMHVVSHTYVYTINRNVNYRNHRV